MKKITLLILCAIFVFTTNTIHAQTIMTSEGDVSSISEEQELNKREESEKIIDQQDEQNNQDNNGQNSTTPSTIQKQSLSDRIKQQAKAVREKVMTQVNRNEKLSARRGVRLVNQEEAKLQKEKQIIDEKINQSAKVYKIIPGDIIARAISSDGENYADLGFYSIAYASDGTRSSLSPETRYTDGPFDGMEVTYKKSTHEDPTKKIVGHEYFYYNYKTNTWYKNIAYTKSGNKEITFYSSGDYINGEFTETNEAPVYTDTSKAISETVGEKFRTVYRKMTDIQSKIENAINTVPESDKINKDYLRKTLENSKQSLISADTKILKLEKIQLTKNIDKTTTELMSGVKKDFLDSKKHLNNILITLKQATKARAIIQTGGGTTGNGGNSGQTDEDNSRGTGTADQSRR